MFPIPWNKAFRKKDGTLVNMEDATGGGSGGSLPEHTSADAGKVLGVTNDGSLAWVEVSGGSTSFKANSEILAGDVVVTAEEVV